MHGPCPATSLNTDQLWHAKQHFCRNCTTFSWHSKSSCMPGSSSSRARGDRRADLCANQTESWLSTTVNMIMSGADPHPRHKQSDYPIQHVLSHKEQRSGGPVCLGWRQRGGSAPQWRRPPPGPALPPPAPGPAPDALQHTLSPAPASLSGLSATSPNDDHQPPSLRQNGHFMCPSYGVHLHLHQHFPLKQVLTHSM